MALIAMRHLKSRESAVSSQQSDTHAGPLPVTSFKGFALSERSHEVSSFECKGCPNVCEINRVKIAGEEGYLFYEAGVKDMM